ncbi:hypothetical protein D9C73_000072 [Collichthys lucidus]|uniref:Sterile alpha motif domain-containing protein 3 n=1 Tax=Collichthys lucidus TaxID=240159 RepID=A0A4U5TWJ5_COLLU|nr:hypothetical protein D9C73_000072 [Collichthys lucidus]
MDKLDDVSIATLRAANIGEDLLPSLSRDDIKDLFPGPENFLRRRAIWLVVNKDEKVDTAPEIQQSPPTGGSNLSKEEASTSKFLTMSNPQYIVFTDSELEQVRRTYFEQKRLGTEHSVALSNELFCRLIRNTMTNMISIARATEDCRYPTKHEVNAMAKRLVDYYPMIKGQSSNSEWVLDELQRVIQPTNSQYISEMKSRWEAFSSKVQFYGVMKKAMKPSKTLNGVAHVTAVFRALPLLFPSSTMPPKKLGLSSEALFHVLTTSEDPDGFLRQLPLSCPVVLVSEDNCMIAIGNMPVTTFNTERFNEGLLYLMAYYYALHLTYPKCISTLLSVLQTEILQDSIHEQDMTPSYKKAIGEWKSFIK